MDLVSRSTDSTVLTMATCLICGGDSEVLFPEWDSIVETDDGRRKIEYTVELTTPALCDGCLAVNELTRPVQAAEEVGVD